MKHAEDLARFLHLVRARLERGAEDYGDASIERPTQDLLGEIVEELADVAGWAAVLAARIFALQKTIREKSDETDDQRQRGDDNLRSGRNPSL